MLIMNKLLGILYIALLFIALMMEEHYMVNHKKAMINKDIQIKRLAKEVCRYAKPQDKCIQMRISWSKVNE